MNYAQIYFKKKQAFFERLTDLRVLFGALIGVSIIIAIIFIIALYRTKIDDPIVSIIPIEPTVLENNNHIVEVNLFVNTFSEFEIIQNNFNMDATIWFSYDENSVSATTIEEFQFENAKIINKSLLQSEKLPNGKTLVSYNVQLSFKGNFNYHYYPFNRHRLNIVLINPSTDIQKLVYVTTDKNFNVSDKAFTKDWKKTSTQTRYGLAERRLMLDNKQTTISYERVIFSINFDRNSLKTLFLIFLPLFLIFFIGLLSLTFDVLTQFTIILSLNLGSTTALLFFAEILNKSSPVTNIITLADSIYFLLLTIVITTLTLQIGMMHYLYKRQSLTQLKEVIDEAALSVNIIRGLCFIFFLFVMLAIVIWLILF